MSSGRLPLFRGPLPAWAAIAAVAGLIAIVTLASRSTAVPLSGALDTRLLFRALEVAGYVALFIGLALIPWVVLLRAGRRLQARSRATAKQRTVPPAPPWAQVIGLILVGGFGAAQVVLMVSILDDLLRAVGAGGNAAFPGAADDPGTGVLSLENGDVTTVAVAAVIAAAIGLGAVLFALKWRRELERGRASSGPPAGEVRRQAAEVSLEALEREPDPRRAIIAAYAAMERSLSRAGLGRIESEAPIEYLTRVLAGATGAGPEIRTVSQLFQVARFSDHQVSERMRAEAIEALERIRTVTVTAA